MLTRLENILTFQRYEKWKVGEKLGSKAHPRYIRIRVITNRVISRFKCSSHGWSNVFVTPDLTKEEREKNRTLRLELEKRKNDEKNPNLVIYRGKIVDRKNISDQGTGKGKESGNGSVSRPVLVV